MRWRVAFPIYGSIDLVIGKWVVIAMLALASGCDVQRPPGPGPGDAVEIDLPTLDGMRLRSADWRGKTVVVNVWASWCGPCREEMASLEALSRRADPARVLVVGVSVDEDLNLAREYLLREHVSFSVAFDRDQAVVKHALGVLALPTTLVVTPDGKLRARVAGAKNWVDAALLESLALPPLAQLPRT